MIRFQNCRGFRLFKFGCHQAELWICPKGEVIPTHTHPNVVSRIVGLFGRMRWTVGDRTRNITGCFRRRETNGRLALAAMKVGAETPHGATITGRLGIFLNLEQWINGTSPTSAATDFQHAR